MSFKIVILCSWVLLNARAEHRSEFGSYGIFHAEPYFNDKTEMLSILFCNPLLNLQDKPYYFITCPYNFGKMMNSLMVKQFAEIELDLYFRPKHWMETYALNVFKNLKISEFTNLFVQHLARYPVIYMDLSSWELTPGSDISTLLTNLLWDSVQKYHWLGKDLSDKTKYEMVDFNIADDDAKLFRNLFKNTTIRGNELDDGLLCASRLLYEYFNRTKVILLINDYERFALQALKNRDPNGVRFYEKLNKMLFQSLTKGSDYIKFALISGTGSLGIDVGAKKYNLFGFSFGHIKKNGLIKHYPFLGDHVFTPFYGFTEDDVRSLWNSSVAKHIFDDVTLGDAYWTADRSRICNSARVSDLWCQVNRPRDYDRYKKFSWIEPEFGRLVVPFFRSKVFKEKMNELEEYGFFNYPIKMSFPSNALKELIELARNEEKSIDDSHVDMFFTFCFQQGYFTYDNKTEQFTFPNDPIKKQFLCQMRALESKSNYLELINLQAVAA